MSKSQRQTLADYEGFVEKFKPKLTTDDCYTPPQVYECVLDYIRQKIGINDNDKIVRPFYPGGDYKVFKYTKDTVVIDNPPFSILTQIVRFYIEKNIRFFLFANHLTLFSADLDCTAIVCGCDVVYENGATVKTSFLTNMLGDLRVVGDPYLYSKLKKIIQSKNNLPKYSYPENVLTVSNVTYLVEKGVSINIAKKSTHFIRALSHQKAHKKSIYGSGFLISNETSKIMQDKRKSAEWFHGKIKQIKQESIVWVLSEEEKNIIKTLK